MTVFLTTQYLEEADVLADRVGIIDHGRIVAEGTPAALKAEIGRPTVEVVPADPARARPRRARSSAASASSCALAERRRRPAASGDADLAEVVRALDAEGLSRDLQLHQPSLDDVFLAKTGRSLEGAGDDDEPRPAGSRWASAGSARRPGLTCSRRRSVVRTLAPAGERRRAARLPAAAARRELGRAARPRRTCPASRRTRSSPSRSPCRSSRARCSRR